PEPSLDRGEDGVGWFVVGDRLYLAAHPGLQYSCAIADPGAGWTVTKCQPWPSGLTVAGEMIFGNDTKCLMARPIAGPDAEWRQVGPWPAGCDVLVAAGGRLLAFGGVGPIYARPVKAAPNEPWVVVGRVHDPWKSD